MERLTKYESIAGHVHAIPIVSDMDAIMMRLAAYEDAGLTVAGETAAYHNNEEVNRNASG